MTTTRIVARLAVSSAFRSVTLFGLFSAVAVLAVAGSYRSLYATPEDRAAVASLIEGNRAFESLFGVAHDIDTVAGFTAWRAGTPVLIVIAVVGLLAATRLLRGEEDRGRWETVLGGAIDAPRATAATLLGLVGLLFLPAMLAGLAFLTADADAAHVAAQAVALWGHAAIFAAIGAVASQVVAPRRRAAAVAAGVMGATFLMRVIADGVDGWGWLRGFTPFGWAELAQPLATTRGGWVLLPFAVAAVLGAVAVAGSRRRDLRAGWLGERGDRRSSAFLLGSAEGYALRSSLRPAVVWTIVTTAMAALLGVLAADIVELFDASDAFVRFASKVAPGFVLSGAEAFLGMAATFLAIPIALSGVYRVLAAGDEETTGRLDVALGGTTRRPSWIAAWAIAGIATALVVSLVAVGAAFGVAALRGADVRGVDALAAALNTVPAAVAFVGVAVLLFGIVPRAAPGIAVGIVGVAEFVALLGAQQALPAWLRDLSPFAHVRPVPSVPADTTGAIVLLAGGAVAGVVGMIAFVRRDVVRA